MYPQILYLLALEEQFLKRIEILVASKDFNQSEENLV
jgi:hypothetical protein